MIILGLIGGATIGGFWGVPLAVPVMAMIKILSGHFWRTRVLGQSWEEASDALITAPPPGENLFTRIRRSRAAKVLSEPEAEPDVESP